MRLPCMKSAMAKLSANNFSIDSHCIAVVKFKEGYSPLFLTLMRYYAKFVSGIVF